jgi:hypothetical protein
MAAACWNIWKERNLRIFQVSRQKMNHGATIHDDYIRDTIMGSDLSFFFDIVNIPFINENLVGSWLTL